jgi:hypothetical protein
MVLAFSMVLASAPKGIKELSRKLSKQEYIL